MGKNPTPFWTVGITHLAALMVICVLCPHVVPASSLSRNQVPDPLSRRQRDTYMGAKMHCLMHPRNCNGGHIQRRSEMPENFLKTEQSANEPDDDIEESVLLTGQEPSYDPEEEQPLLLPGEDSIGGIPGPRDVLALPEDPRHNVLDLRHDLDRGAASLRNYLKYQRLVNLLRPALEDSQDMFWEGQHRASLVTSS